MTQEKLAEYQYSSPLGEYITQFPLGFPGMNGNQGKLGNYPGEGWIIYNKATQGAMYILLGLRKSDPQLEGMSLFRRIVEEVQKGPEYGGRTSHVLLALLHRGYFDDMESVHTGLTEEIWDKNSGNCINPTFREDTDKTDLPANLQMRKAIINAISSDMTHHKKIAYSSDNSNDATAIDLAGQRAQWYQSLHNSMSQKVQIKPSEYPLI